MNESLKSTNETNHSRPSHYQQVGSERELMGVLEGDLFDGHWEWDLENDRWSLSSRFKQFLGHGDSELPDTPDTWKRLIFPEDLKKLIDNFKRYQESDGNVSFAEEVRFSHKDGITVWMFCRGQATEWSTEKKIKRISGIFFDISERKRREEDLKNVNRYLNRIIDDKLKELEVLAAVVTNSEDAILSKNLDGIITSWNKGAENLYGYTAREMVGQHVYKIVPDSKLDEMKALFEQLEKGKGIDNLETLRKRKDGRVIDVSLAVSPVKDVDDNVIGYSAIGRDITKRKELHRQVEEMNDHLLRANQAKDEFIAQLSHELRTPINIIFGFLHILKVFPPNSKEYKNAIKKIDSSSKSLLELVDDLMDVSQITSGKMKLNTGTYDVKETIENALDAVRLSIKSKKINVLLDVKEKNPLLVCDKERIHQVLWNLLTNAIKFSDEGGEIRVVAGQVGTMLEISVRDNGAGISEKDVSRVFDRLWQSKRSKGPARGLGLGLFICKQIVEAHGGLIKAASEGPGKGSEFTLSLPIQAVQQDERTEGAESMALKGSNVLAGLKVLILDDTKEALTVLKIILGQAGAKVVAKSSPNEALEVVKNDDIEFIISDIGMPEMNGYEFIEEVRKLEKAKACGPIPAIALTAFSGKDDKQLSMESGFNLHLVKPASPEKLIASIQKFAF